MQSDFDLFFSSVGYQIELSMWLVITESNYFVFLLSMKNEL